MIIERDIDGFRANMFLSWIVELRYISMLQCLFSVDTRLRVECQKFLQKVQRVWTRPLKELLKLLLLRDRDGVEDVPCKGTLNALNILILRLPREF